MTDTEALVRHAYHFAQGDVLDIQGFIDLFAEDGVFNAGQEQSYRGEHLGDVLVWMGKLVPDVRRDLHRVNVLGDVVAIELSIQVTTPSQSRTAEWAIRSIRTDSPTTFRSP